MATKEKDKAKGRVNNLPPRKEHKYNVDSIAKLFDVNPATMRMKLRNAEVAKDGGTYGWDSEKAMNAAADEVKAASKEPAAKPKVKAAGTEKAKPAAKGAVAKPKAKVRKAA